MEGKRDTVSALRECPTHGDEAAMCGAPRADVVPKFVVGLQRGVLGVLAAVGGRDHYGVGVYFGDAKMAA